MSRLSPQPDGFKLSPKASTSVAQSVYAAGTPYQLTQTPALLTFGTTSPSLVLGNPGTYLLIARVVLNYNAATFAASRVATLKLRRINNTAADLPNSSITANTDIITLITSTMGAFPFAPVIYMTQNNNDNIQIFGDVATVPTAGSLDAAAAEIIAIKLS